MNRVYVFKDKSYKNGKVMVLENTLEEFKSKISALFDIVEDNVKIYSSNGCEIHDLRVIRDDENVYLLPSEKQNNEDCDSIENSTKDLEEGVENAKSKIVSDWITLNVGGKRFTTSRATLLAKEPLSMLARMFADDNNMYLMNPSATDETGAYLIDRSPEYFEPILNYLRHGNVVLDNHVNPKGVLEEAIFYGKYKISSFFFFSHPEPLRCRPASVCAIFTSREQFLITVPTSINFVIYRFLLLAYWL